MSLDCSSDKKSPVSEATALAPENPLASGTLPQRMSFERLRKELDGGARPIPHHLLAGKSVSGYLHELSRAVSTLVYRNRPQAARVSLEDFCLGGHPIEPGALASLYLAYSKAGFISEAKQIVHTALDESLIRMVKRTSAQSLLS